MDIDELIAHENEIIVVFPYSIEEPIKIEKDVPIKLPYYLLEFLLENEHCRLKEEFFNEKFIGQLKNIPEFFSIKDFKNYYEFATFFGERKLIKYFLIERMKIFCDSLTEDEIPSDYLKYMDFYEEQLIRNAKNKLLEFKMHKNPW